MSVIEQAVEHLRHERYDRVRDLLRSPKDAASAYLLGFALVRMGRTAEALPHLERAAAHAPAQRDAIVEYGCALFEAGRWNEGIDQLRRAAGLFPDVGRVHAVLARMMLDGGMFVDGLEHCLRAMHLMPNDGWVMSLFASCLAGLGRAEQAAEWYAKAAQACPDDARLRANLCFALNSVPGVDQAIVLHQHREFGRIVSAGAIAAKKAPCHGGPAGKVRLGFLSPDFREHPVSRFLSPLLRHLDRSRFEAVAYASVVRPDGVTRHIQAMFDAWHDILNLGDDALAEQVRRDGVNVLIDLAGLTGGTRVGVMSRRAAPVQATYLGYPNTTGVPGVDVRIVDAITDPAGSEARATERLLRLPGCLVCFEPSSDAAARDAWEASLATLRAPRPLTFGSFNNATKMSDATLALFGAVLEGVPGSRLVLKAKGLNEGKCRSAMHRRMAEAGIDADRVGVLRYEETHAGHLSAYGHVDIALDTYPYSGTTTTCEALWMGVPVVTLAGPTHASRVSASILGAAGRDGWVAHTPDEYVAIAASLAKDRPARADLRAGVEASPLCDAARFTRGFEAAILDALQPTTSVAA